MTTNLFSKYNLIQDLTDKWMFYSAKQMYKRRFIGT